MWASSAYIYIQTCIYYESPWYKIVQQNHKKIIQYKIFNKNSKESIDSKESRTCPALPKIYLFVIRITLRCLLRNCRFGTRWWSKKMWNSPLHEDIKSTYKCGIVLHRKITGNWQKESCTTKILRKIHK